MNLIPDQRPDRDLEEHEPKPCDLEVDASRETTGKVLKGLQDLDEYHLDCASCELPLAIVKKVSSAGVECEYIAHCLCGDESWPVKIIGSVYVGPAEGRTLSDMPVVLDKNNRVVKTIIKVI